MQHLRTRCIVLCEKSLMAHVPKEVLSVTQAWRGSKGSQGNNGNNQQNLQRWCFTSSLHLWYGQQIQQNIGQWGRPWYQPTAAWDPQMLQIISKWSRTICNSGMQCTLLACKGMQGRGTCSGQHLSTGRALRWTQRAPRSDWPRMLECYTPNLAWSTISMQIIPRSHKNTKK